MEREIEELKKDVELKFGRRIETSSDFDVLYLSIKGETGKDISVSTLKRLWKYVNYSSSPRVGILSILATYIGYKDWYDFLESDKVNDSSDFLNKNIIDSRTLKEGEEIEIS